jgi:hypothetical protein
MQDSDAINRQERRRRRPPSPRYVHCEAPTVHRAQIHTWHDTAGVSVLQNALPEQRLNTPQGFSIATDTNRMGPRPC